jgi:hypothetical protein
MFNFYVLGQYISGIFYPHMSLRLVWREDHEDCKLLLWKIKGGKDVAIVSAGAGRTKENH